MDYILQLRQYIGHRPVLMVGAAILVLDKQDRLLMLRRSDSGLWGIPGGATEPGEVVEEAARRETFEETNLKIIECLCSVYSRVPSFITNIQMGMKFIMSPLCICHAIGTVK